MPIMKVENPSTTDAHKVINVLADDTGALRLAGHSAVTDALNVEEIDPVSEHYATETLADITDGADDTYYYYVDMHGYKHYGLQLVMDCDAGTVTATVEATAQDDGTAQGSCVYTDVTNAWFGVASLVSAAVPASAIWQEENTPGACKYVRVKIVAATGANTGDWALYHKRLY